jgi:hypothetical protein
MDNRCDPSGVPPFPDVNLCHTRPASSRDQGGSASLLRYRFQLFSGELLSKTTFWQTTTESAPEQGATIIVGKKGGSSRRRHVLVN